MKRFYIFTILFFVMGWAYNVSAQDLIILRDGNTIEAKVLEISPTEIRYKRIDHLDGPTIVIMAIDVLSIRYENGRTEIINTITQPITPITLTPPTAVQAVDQQNLNPRLNTIGVTVGYQGISAFGFTVNGTVSPGNYTFFDFNLGLGFNSFAFNGRINFNAFVPFKIGGWYAGAGIGGGYNEIFGGIFAGNITTGFILFNWLNIGYTLQIGTFDGIINHNAFAGYSYRFKSQQDNVTNSEDTSQQQQKREPRVRQPAKVANERDNYISGELQLQGLQSVGIGAKYERMINSKISLGSNVYLNPFGYSPFGIDAFFRFYPWGKSFFLGTGIGLELYRPYFYSLYDGDRNIIYGGLAITPEIGWKIDVGKAGGFYLQPGIAMPFVFREHFRSEDTFGFDVFYRPYFGMGYAF